MSGHDWDEDLSTCTKCGDKDWMADKECRGSKTNAAMPRRLNLELDLCSVGHLVIVGGTQIGKSIVLDRIEKILREEFGASTISLDLEHERRASDFDVLEPWQKEMVSKTIWCLSEKTI